MATKSKQFKPQKHSGQKAFTRQREPRLYDKFNWVEYRNKFLYHNPKCYCCSEKAKVVDHIVAHKGDEKLFWNKTNYLPLCKKCHDTITALFDRHSNPKTEEKMQWIEKARIDTQTNVIVRVVDFPKNNH